jgi:hypothetical protein
MPIMFNTLLHEAGLSLADVRLIRHKDKRATKGRTPYELWRDNRPQFELYQSLQKIRERSKLGVPYWAVFIVNSNDKTMFAGLYAVQYAGLLEEDIPMPHMDGIHKAEKWDRYDLELQDTLRDLIGKLFIDWGSGDRAWIQYANRQNKAVTELREAFQEDPFPGFLELIMPLSKLAKMPKSWKEVLKSSRGIYLLTCPKTKEWYIGKADSKEGFWGRWQNYVKTGHGDNVALKSNDPSDYQFTILEVAGTAATPAEIESREVLWKAKLKTRAMGLNRN